MMLDGDFSPFVSVKSGVPQGTVLDRLMLLLYINDISENNSSLLCLFADCLRSSDLNHLDKWA